MNPDNRVMVLCKRLRKNERVLALLLCRGCSLAIQLCAPASPGPWIWPKRPGKTKRSGGRL
eukprot:COSAG06_NODE_17_length_34906_cov_31.908268_39_plen_61_part_00